MDKRELRMKAEVDQRKDLANQRHSDVKKILIISDEIHKIQKNIHD